MVDVTKIWPRARVIGGAAILGVLGWRLGSGPFLDALRVVSVPTLLAALAIGAVTTVLSAWRWTLVARGLGMRLPLAAAVGDYYRALFLNAVLPGGVLGDVHRAVRHGRDVGDVALGVKAVVLERTAGQVVLVTAGVAALLTPGAVPHPGLPAPGAAVPVAAVTVALAVAAVTLAVRSGAPRAVRALARVRTWAGDARRGLLAPGIRAGIAASSAAVLAGHLATFVLAARATGSTAPLARLVPLMLLALLAMAVPVNVGGWGPREGVTAWAFAAAGLSATQGLTIAVVYGLFALVASLPGVAVLAARRTSAARLRRSPGLAVGVP